MGRPALDQAPPGVPTEPSRELAGSRHAAVSFRDRRDESGAVSTGGTMALTLAW